MSTHKAYDEMSLDEKIAELDRDDQDSAQAHRGVDPAGTPTATREPRSAATHTQAQDQDAQDQDQESSESSAPSHVVTMQALLEEHESAAPQRTDDPDLNRVLVELRNLAHSNIADVFESKSVLEYIGVDEAGDDVYNDIPSLQVRDITTLPREVTACIQSLKVTSTAKGQIVEVKLYDKQVSLDKLMRFHGAYVKDNEQVKDSRTGIMDLLISSIGSQGLPVLSNNDA